MRTTKLVIRKKNTEPIRFDKRVECKVECNMVECNNVLSWTHYFYILVLSNLLLLVPARQAIYSLYE